MPTIPENLLIAWDVTTGRTHSLGHPPGRFRFANPQMMVDARDRVHLFWGELEGGPGPISGDFARVPAVSLWTSMYDQADGWSPPRMLFGDSLVRLRMHLTIVPAQSEKTPGPWGLSITKDPRPRGSYGVILVGFDADQRAVALDVPDIDAIYSSVQSRGKRVYLGFVGGTASSNRRRSPSGVYFQSSRDSGRTWQPPVSIAPTRPGRHNPHSLQTILAPDGTIYLVWKQERGELDDVFRVVVSRDEGKTWSALEDLIPPPTVEWVHAAADVCGTLQFAWEHRDWSVDRAHIDHASWRDGWSPIEHVFTDLDTNMPQLHRTHDGRFLLSFAARPPVASDSVPYTNFISERKHRSR
jgi:hypothetical protein